jgi:ATP/ADP translocase
MAFNVCQQYVRGIQVKEKETEKYIYISLNFFILIYFYVFCKILNSSLFVCSFANYCIYFLLLYNTCRFLYSRVLQIMARLSESILSFL